MTECDNEERLRLLAGLRTRLELDRGLGIEFLSLEREEMKRLAGIAAAAGRPGPPKPAPAGTRTTAERFPSPKPERRESRPVDPPPGSAGRTSAGPSKWAGFSLVPFAEPVDRPERRLALAGLEKEAQTCRGCRLCEKRTTVVWGEGDLEAAVMFVGEGPGKDEDEQGRPFVGRSGRLLTDIIEKGMKVERRAVYITNVVKCRPPGNRDPKDDETAACRRYLDRQIEAVRPKVLVAVGGVAGCALLGLPPKTSGLRGRWREYAGIPLRVIFHPSYLLRQRAHENDRTDADKATWKDIQEVMRRASQAD